jgi:hypothetical protein
MQIDDGQGKGISAGVNKDNRLLTSAITLDAIDAAGQVGEAFNVTTDVVTLTNALENAVLYLANTNPTQNLHLQRLAYGFGKATTTGDVIVRTYVNPTSGTLISAGTPISFQQRNLGSRFVAQASAFKMAAVGQTQVGGILISSRVFQDAGDAEILSGFLIPAGSSLVITVQAPAANTSMKLAITAATFFLDKL